MCARLASAKKPRALCRQILARAARATQWGGGGTHTARDVRRYGLAVRVCAAPAAANERASGKSRGGQAICVRARERVCEYVLFVHNSHKSARRRRRPRLATKGPHSKRGRALEEPPHSRAHRGRPRENSSRDLILAAVCARERANARPRERDARSLVLTDSLSLSLSVCLSPSLSPIPKFTLLHEKKH